MSKKSDTTHILRKCKINERSERKFLLENIMKTYMPHDLIESCKVSTRKRKFITQIICGQTEKAGEKECKKKLEPLYPVIPKINTAHENLRNFSQGLKQIEMHRFLEARIRKRIRAKGLETVYPKLVDDSMIQLRIDFLEVTHSSGVDTRTHLIGPSKDDPCIPTPYKFLGKTENYPKYLKHKAQMERKWILYLPLIRKILDACVTQLPEIICDIGIYHYTHFFELVELTGRFYDCTDYFNRVLKHFRVVVGTLIDGDKTKLKTYQVNHYFSAISGLQGVYIYNSIRQTIKHIVAVVGDERRVPFLRLAISYKHGLILQPSSQQVANVYRDLIYGLVNMGKNYLLVEKNSVGSYEEHPLNVDCLDGFLEANISQMFSNVQEMFEPVLKFLAEVDARFGNIYKDISRELSVVEWKDKNAEAFAHGRKLIEHYKDYMNKATEIQCTDNFVIGQLSVSEYVENLKTSLYLLIEEIFLRLCEDHQAENEAICEIFEDIKAKSLEIPKNTEELIKQGKYMVHVKAVIVIELTERIKQLLKALVHLVDYGTLTKEHMEMNRVTIRWLRNINTILDDNSTVFEQLKFEAGEKLHAVVSAVRTMCRNMIPKVTIFNDMDDIQNVRDYMLKLSPIMVELRDINTKIDWLNKEETFLGFPVTQYEEYNRLTQFVYPFYHLIKMCLQLIRKLTVWFDGQFEFLNYEETETFIEDNSKEFIKTGKLFRNKIRIQRLDQDPLIYDGTPDDNDTSNWPAPLKLCMQAALLIKDFRWPMIMMRIMCNDALLERHWKEMSEIAGFDLTPNAGTTLRKMLAMGLEPNIDLYDVVSNSATRERDLLHNLRRMQAEWREINFKTSMYKDTGLSILTALDDVQVVLDDHIIKALTMRGSVFVKPYETEVRSFYDKLVRVNKTIEEWGKVQSQWLYLLPIFSSKDIVAQMPEEGMLFREVNDTYKKYMENVVRDPRVMETAGTVGVLESMLHCLELLEQINDGVASYLEKKRLFFPRFFFLSNDEMLEILSETKDPLKVQPHLKKCFEAINKLQFDENMVIHEMISGEGERVKLKNTITPKESGGSVEKWLVLVEEQMVVSIRDQILKSNKHYVMLPRTQWVLKWQGQIVLAVSQVQWTAAVHRALNVFEPLEVATFSKDLKDQLNDIVALIRDPTLTNLARITIKALIVIDVHAKDVVQELLDKGVQHDKEFKWLSQLRYYVEDDECLVRLINATVKYAYEYLGNTDRLVITPLTDRCYRTLIGAYHLHLNGAPEGPAGTGKTETTKDLAKALAVQCVVFNCSDGLDYKAMGKFFKGLASCGAWVCFDEFNRIDIEVLSVVAQQILCIIVAVRGHMSKFLFEGTELKLNPTCYVCITMNPGYAGRTELPDNLKVLFRTVAMMVPDYAMIGEISLYSFGFIDARNLSVKIVTVYRLCSEQLSSQNHYDYGMRAVKSVLSAAGNNKRQFPTEKEDILLLRAILDVNLPKFLSHDLPLFAGIISDLFPGIVLPQADYVVFTKAVTSCAEKRNLQPRESFILKIIQTYEMMIVRHGFMLVGDPYAGKTSTLKVLADALTLLNEQGHDQLKVQYEFLNPKAITMGQLYGQFDPISYEWFDGVVSNTFRNFTVDISPDRKWIIFDGPVDAVWIENMNSALDDNKKLCLMSGEVMSMTASMSLIFEVKDLEQASPATVSRCGMIYMEPVTLGWRPFLESWMPFQSEEWREEREELVFKMFDWLTAPCLTFINKSCVQYCSPGDISLVNTALSLFQIYLDDAWSKSTKQEEDGKFLKNWIEATFVQVFIWGIGGILNMDSRRKFDEFFRNLFTGKNPQHPIPDDFEKIELTLPVEGILADYTFQYKGKGMWRYVLDIVKNERVEEADNLQQVLVPTVETQKYTSFVRKHIRHKRPFLLVGPTGTGKSYYIQDLMLNKLDIELYEPGFITFTVQITCNQTQELIISKLNKKRRGIYGPTKGKTAVIFIDDVNMPQKEIYGAQPPIELVRQYFDHKNLFDLKTTEKLFIEDTMFIGAMGLVGGSRQEVYSRFLRHFNIISINEFTQESMAKIYTNILHLGWKNNGFSTDILMTASMTIQASLAIYQNAIVNLRPTPSKSHYVFNLRDFSRLVMGCSMLRKESVTDAVGKKIFPKIWVHEVFRIFYDRLIEQDDKNWLFEKVKQVVRDTFRDSMESVFDNLPRTTNNEITLVSLKNLMFGTYFDQDSADDEKRYEESASIEAFRELAATCMDDYNASHKTKMDIVLFDYALEHLSKICRILSMPCGSGLLVGISGSGRQSLTTLASELYGMKMFQPEISKNYGLNEWREDIKKVLKESGGMGRNCTFLIAEGQIKEENFLQDIDCLLNSGEVPNIYQIDEKQEILDMVRLAAQGGNRNIDISALTVFFYFTRRCREKLHILLCFSPVGSTFRNRLRLFPSLINCCTIDWFEEWPTTALEEVAQNWMEGVNLSADIKKSAVTACKTFHVDAREASVQFYNTLGRKTYITSASYLELIKSFVALTNSKQNELMKARNRYLGGLDKLQHAASSISEMQQALAELQPKLKEQSVKATAMKEKIEKETKTVEQAAAIVKRDEKIANKQAYASQALKKECEADLAEVLPIYDEALAALDTLKPADITLVKSMKNPPYAIKMVLTAVCIMKDIKPNRVPDPGTGRMTLDYWKPSVKMLGDMNFLQSLKDYDKDNIKPEIIAKIRKEYLPLKEFKPHLVAKASSAAEGLCKWILAMDKYDEVVKVVAPKRAKLAQAEKELAETMALLNAKKEEMARLEEALADLNEKLDEAIKKQTELQDNVNLCNDKLIRARKLIGGLGGERTRWIEAADFLLGKYEGLAGDILISVGIISYLSPFNAQFRQRIVDKWHIHVKELKIPCADIYDFEAILGVDVLIQNWYIYGLPRDTFSTENAIIQANSRRCSLFIDPQSQASTWIKKFERHNNLEVVKFSYSDYMKKIESCIISGYPVLIEGIEEILEAPLDPLLYKKTFKQAGMLVISLGENVVEYHPDFKLYMCSKYRNPHYLPEIFNKVTIINFALTLDGLQDQLLGIVVAVEKPELQQLKEDLIVQKAENKAALLNVEENILRTLAESKGDILEDETAIQVLDESKILSTEIREKQEQSLEIEKSIEEFRVKYQGVAEHSSVLYYCISDLANVDPMYQYSLEWFISLYVSSIQKAEKFRVIEKRCQSLINGFTFDLYANITRSLFEKHKLLFSFLLCVKILVFQKKLTDLEIMFLLTGGIRVENPLPNPSDWLPKESWDEMCRASELEGFRGFREDFSEDAIKWKYIYDDTLPENCKLLSPWNNKLNNFMKLLVIKLLRPDRVLVAITNFVRLELGEKFTKPMQFNIALSFAEAYSLSPLIFILSPGTDPMQALTNYAVDRKMQERFNSISLGQGQGPIAETMIEQAQSEGNWVCLQNCHLSTSWMPTLEKIFESMDFGNTHDNFRLWLTSYPSEKFPVTLLQKGVKMTNEPPTGLQQNLLKSYTNDPLKNPEFFEGCIGKEETFSRLLYGVAFFHAVVQERRTFGALGWNISYGFNDSDFDISVQQVQMFINESDEPYEALSYLIGECNYGGRVTDDWDRRLIVTILNDFLSPEVATNRRYKFVEIDNPCYGCPNKVGYEYNLQHINAMPVVHPPEVFGLHTNAGITRDLQNSNILLNDVLKAYGEIHTTGAVDTDLYLMTLTGDLLNRLPPLFDIEKAQEKFPVTYGESMNTVLVQEMQRFNKLLKVITATLAEMQKAIKGLVAMSPVLEAFSSSLILARIPASWMSVSYPSLKNLPNYIKDFLARIELLQTWYDNNKPESYWVSGFFFTQAFLTGVKQNYARKYTIAIDKLTYDFKVMDTENRGIKGPADGAYIYGLFTDGGRWSKHSRVLTELMPKVLNDSMPMIWVIPIHLDDLKINDRYNCPVYKTSVRKGTLSTTGHSTNYVLPILLPTSLPNSHWIKRSMALLCQLDN